MTNMTGSHGHFHIGLVIIPRPPYWPETIYYILPTSSKETPILAWASIWPNIILVVVYNEHI
jgi:hypothetical protein